jgi:hypothetical protein
MNTRKTSTSAILLMLSAPLCLAGLLAGSAAGPSAPAAADAKYLGANRCKGCHSGEEIGKQYVIWSTTKHSKAFETLGSDNAKELAKAKGIEDPQKADACLKCHVTAFGEPAETIDKGFKQELGVQCESCHGPGEAHRKARMASAAETDPSKEIPVSPTEINATPKIDTCHRCHNPESPTYKPFCFKESFGKIVHLIPHKKRTPEQLKKETDPFGCGDAGSCQCPKPEAAAPK